MKQSIFALFIVLSLSASAATNDVIDLGRRPATFSDLRGHTYRGVLLVRGDLDGVVYAEAQSTGGGRVSYTNLAPATLEALLIPTNRIALAAARAVSKTRTDREYLAAQARAAAEQKAKAEGFERDRPKREAAAKQAAQQEKTKARAEAIATQAELVKQLQRQNERLGDKYSAGPPAVYNIGGPDDPNVVSAQYFESKKALREATYKLEDLKAGK